MIEFFTSVNGHIFVECHPQYVFGPVSGSRGMVHCGEMSNSIFQRFLGRFGRIFGLGVGLGARLYVQ